MASKQTSEETSCLASKSIWFEQYIIFHTSGWTKCACVMEWLTAMLFFNPWPALRGKREEKRDSKTLCFHFCCLLVINIPNQCKGISSSVKGRFCSAGAKLCITEASMNAESSAEIMLVNEAEPDSASSSSFELRVIPWSAHWTPTVDTGMPRRRSKKCNVINVLF